MSKFAKGILITSAVCLILGISIIIIVGVTEGFGFLKNTAPNLLRSFETEEIYQDFAGEDITELKVDIDYGSVEIKTGNAFSVSGKSLIKDTFSVKNESGKLNIIQSWKSKDNIWKVPQQEIVITIPEDFYADDVELKFGAGEVKIDGLKTKNGYYKFGVGDVELKNCKADKIKLKTGVGDVVVRDSEINDADLETGVGELKYYGVMTGDCDISAGVGEMYLYLSGNPDEYYFDLNAGIGGVWVDLSESGNGAKSYENRSVSIGKTGSINKIRIKSGVGEVRVDMK